MNKQIISIHDPNFEQAIRRVVNKPFENIYQSDLEQIKDLGVRCLRIKSLQGIEYFTNLEVLDCSFNQLTNLDVSKNVNLAKLYCSNSQLTSLDISKNVNLTTLYCSENQLTSLDLSKNVKLIALYCSKAIKLIRSKDGE